MKTLVSALLLLSCVSSSAHALSPDRQRAWEIAARAVRHNVVPVRDPRDSSIKQYLLAGAHQFHDLWIRDFSMSTAGAMDLGLFDAVHDSLEMIFSLQRPEGTLPRVVDNEDVTRRTITGALGFPGRFHYPLRGWFETENNVLVIDGNATTVWAASEYVTRSHDLNFARRWFPAAENALHFLETHYGVDGLIGNQPPFADWADSVARTGRVSFTNEFYILALRGLSAWAWELGLPDKAASYAIHAEETTKIFHDYFWDSEKGVVRNFEGDDHLTADANIMAVAYGLLPPADSRRVMDVLRHSPLWSPMPGRATWPNYPSSMKDLIVKLVGIADYHDSMYWFWLTALAARAEQAMGNCEGYETIMDALADKIAHDGHLYEVYKLQKDGTTLHHVHRIIYHAEMPFTWSSAMYVQAEAEGCDRRL